MDKRRHIITVKFFNSIYIEIKIFSKIKFTLVYRPFFPIKNDQKWEMLTILPYIDGIVGSIFYILGRFAKMSPPNIPKTLQKSGF